MPTHPLQSNEPESDDLDATDSAATGLTFDRRNLATLLAETSGAATAFLETLDERPAGVSPKEPDQPLALVERGRGTRAALRLLQARYEAGISGSAGPRYLGFVTGGSTPAALMGDWLTSAYDQNVSHGSDSIASTVERETLGMLRQLFEISERFEGAFVSGATMANVVALATARQWISERAGGDVAEDGLAALPPISVLAGSPHASIAKALALLGMGRQSLVTVPSLKHRVAVDPAALAQRLRSLGGRSAIVVASAGDVNTGDFDDLSALAELCRRYDCWLHVDGAFGLFAACDPRFSARLDGLEQADSIATDGHKWLNVPYDSGLVFTRHLAEQEKVFRATAAYLGDGPDLLHRTPENSRRFRALPAWMTLVAYGREGYRALVRRCCDLAAALGAWIERSAAYELLTPIRLNIVCFALQSVSSQDQARGDEPEPEALRRDRLLAYLLEDGRVFLSPTVFDGRAAVRVAFSNWRSDESDLVPIIAALEDAARSVARNAANG